MPETTTSVEAYARVGTGFGYLPARHIATSPSGLRHAITTDGQHVFAYDNDDAIRPVTA